MDLVHVETGIGEELEVLLEESVLWVRGSWKLVIVVSWGSHVGRLSAVMGDGEVVDGMKRCMCKYVGGRLIFFWRARHCSVLKGEVLLELWRSGIAG